MAELKSWPLMAKRDEIIPRLTHMLEMAGDSLRDGDLILISVGDKSPKSIKIITGEAG